MREKLENAIYEILEMLDFINSHGGFAEYNDYSELHDAVSLLPCNDWISVDDALPPDGQIVIGAVYTTDIIHLNAGESLEDGLKRTNKEAEQHPRVEPCWYGHDGLGDPETVGWYGYDGFPMVCHPRYWMPLPQPPEVKE